jgi:hypothetical protein
VFTQVSTTGWQSIEIVLCYSALSQNQWIVRTTPIQPFTFNENQSLFLVRVALKPAIAGFKAVKNNKSTARGSRMPMRHTSMVVSQGIDMKRAYGNA